MSQSTYDLCCFLALACLVSGVGLLILDRVERRRIERQGNRPGKSISFR